MDTAQALFALLTNPNVAYVLLVAGLLALVLAIAVPGTGFIEIAAVVCLALAIIGLSQLPVNLAGIALIALGLVMFLIDLKVQSGLVALGGAIALGLGSLFLFRPGEQAIVVSWWLILAVTLGSAVLFGFGTTRALRAMRTPPRLGMERLIGTPGVLRTTLTPEGNHFVGTALVDGELWTVRADEPLAENTEIIVRAVEGLTLYVVPKHNEASANTTPRSGAL